VSTPLRLFEGYGIELEYMIVDVSSLDVRPVADAVLFAAAGEPANEVELGEVGWSNELALHVLELKTSGPAPSLEGLAARFQEHVDLANTLLAPLGARLLPSGMHPWMDPARETRLWPHEQNEIYRAFDRVFGARGHGWSNLQSTHLNLPFGDEAEFVRLHAAIRAVLPLVPALAASSPFIDGEISGLYDTRLEVYRRNQRKIPSLTGKVVPEPVSSIAEYHERILGRCYRDIAPFDPEGVLQHEWLNSRGAIARFERDAIELRVVDNQECPRADLAVLALIVAAVRALSEERWASIAALNAIPTRALQHTLLNAVSFGAGATVNEAPLLRALGIDASTPVAARAVWAQLRARLADEGALERDGWGEVLDAILGAGTLAERLLRATGRIPDRARLHAVYQDLAGCLTEGRVFLPR